MSWRKRSFQPMGRYRRPMAAMAVTVGDCNARSQISGKKSCATCSADEACILARRGALRAELPLDFLDLVSVAVLRRLDHVTELACLLLQAVDERLRLGLHFVRWFQAVDPFGQLVQEILGL